MKKPESIQFILSTGKGGLIPSVNSIYKACIKWVAGKPIAQIYKDGEIKKLITHFEDQLRQIDFKTQAPWIWEKDAIFDLQIQAIFKQSFFRRDSDNLNKVLIDSLFRHLGLNDSRVITVQTSKAICPDLTEEKICFNLSQSTAEIKFDKLEEPPIPEKIFLGGTCGDSTWRDELIPALDKLGYQYFNPVVPDWTPECKAIEDTEKEDLCDCHLYIITPTMKGVYSIAEIINSAHEVKELGTGSMIFGLLGREEDWGKTQWASLQAVIGLVSKISEGSKKIIATHINSPLDILSFLGTPKKRRKKATKIIK